jgi:hypothetical protein
MLANTWAAVRRDGAEVVLDVVEDALVGGELVVAAPVVARLPVPVPLGVPSSEDVQAARAAVTATATMRARIPP